MYITRYLFGEDFRKCPVCNEMISLKQLRPVAINESAKVPAATDRSPMKFDLCRRKKGSITPFLFDAEQAELDSATATEDGEKTSMQLPMVNDASNATYARICRADAK